MKKILLLSLFICFSTICSAQRHVFFLHNMYVELYGLEGSHPEYGKVEYGAIVDSFKKAGYNVISELRPKSTDGKEYAKKVAFRIQGMLDKDVKPSNITVVGTSKGGYIAMYVSSMVKNKDINYVLIGCCSEESEKNSDIVLHGNILSIRERSDQTTSCKTTSSKPGNGVTIFKEIELNTGRKHGFLYKALPEWLYPSMLWAKGRYADVK